MKTYELTYLVSPDASSEDVESKAKEIEAHITSKEGTILKQSNPVAKTLSYPIQKRASGFLGSLEFQLEPEKLLEVKEILVKDGKIVRHMLIIKEADKFKKERRTRTKPTPEAEQKTEGKPAEQEDLPAKTSEAKPKVELKDIEEKLDEILGE